MAHGENGEESVGDRLLLWGGLGALLLAILLAIGIAVSWPSLLDTAGAPRATNVTVLPASQIPPAPATGAAEPVDAAFFHQFALNALLAPLLDDATPPRWSSVGLQHFCDEETRVLVNGEPMVEGAAIPDGPFSIRWDMNHCEPLGHSVVLAGSVLLQVSHTPDGLQALVVPQGLRVFGAQRKFRPVGPFTATLSMVKGHVEP